MRSGTAAMLGLNELSVPHVHYNPSLGTGGNNFLVHHEPIETPPVSETRASLPTPPSGDLLAPREQEVFDAVLGDPRLSLTWDNLAPEHEFVAGSPFSAHPSSLYPFSADFAPPKEASFPNQRTNQTDIFSPSLYPNRWV